jgi:nucleoside-diphosphate-sugar epimerase
MADRPTVGIVGASGFIGSRLVEWLVLRNLANVRPIVRTFKGMARLARFDLDCRVADATDRADLETQLKGCEVLFHCVVGERDTILKSAAAAYHAGKGTGVQRLVYLSSAVVHGHDPTPGTHDDSELVARQPFEYNVSKVMAEQLLRRLRTDGAIEVVTLRPSIVFGPRSRWWTAQIASDLLSGKAYLVDGGAGICNSVYVDNLVQAMWQAGNSSKVANQDFLITDGERVTWWDLYSAVAEALGVDMANVSLIGGRTVTELIRVARRKEVMEKVSGNQLARAARQIIPPGVVEVIKRKWNSTQLQACNATRHERDRQALPAVDREIVSLQQCHYVLPIIKAQELLGYAPQVTFSEGCHRTAGWLRFALGMSQD